MKWILINEPATPRLFYILSTQSRVYWEYKSNRKAMNRNWNNQKSHPALKTKKGNK